MPILAGLILIGASLASAHEGQQDHAALPTEACDLHFSNGTVLQGVPVAKTPAQRARGLSGRDHAGPGMLFSWDKAEERAFWMRDTCISLTIGFFDETGRLFAITDMEPLSDERHASGQEALDALELAQGMFQQHGLQEGVQLVRRTCSPLRPTR